ncbi:hypothetical protein ACT691_20190 [Vibrio metschnikovii]
MSIILPGSFIDHLIDKSHFLLTLLRNTVKYASFSGQSPKEQMVLPYRNLRCPGGEIGRHKRI